MHSQGFRSTHTQNPSGIWRSDCMFYLFRSDIHCLPYLNLHPDAGQVLCTSCGGLCISRTANTEANRGRKFYKCEDPGCGFFKYVVFSTHLLCYITLPHAYFSGIMENISSLSIPLFSAMRVSYHYSCSWSYKGVITCLIKVLFWILTGEKATFVFEIPLKMLVSYSFFKKKNFYYFVLVTFVYHGRREAS
jgi:hypothetical protein